MKTKPNPILRSSVLAASFTLGFFQSANALEYTWDTTATAGIQAGNGVWGTDAFWTTDGGTTRIVWPGSSHTATFAGTSGTYTVQLSGNITTALGATTLGALNFATDGYSLQSNSASLTRTITIGTSNTAGIITVGSGVTATIGNRVKVTKSGTGGQLDLYGGGTLVIGSGTAGGGASLDTTNGANSSFINANTTLEIKAGGLATYGNSLGLGNTSAGGGTVNITGGDLKIGAAASNLILQNAASQTAASTVTISSGSIEFTNTSNTGGIRFGPSGGSASNTTNLTGTLNLDGGTVIVNKIYMGGAYTVGAKYTAVVNLNGGILKALATNANFFEGITNANNGSSGSGAFVKSGGAKFDSNGKAIAVAQVLQSAVAGPALDGGLTLDDTAVTKGTLTLSANNTYTGATTISAGTLSAGNIVVSGGSSNLGNATSSVTLGAASTQGTLSYTGSSAIYTRGFTIGGAGGGRLDVTTSGQTLQVDTGGVTGSGLFTVGGAGNTSIGANLTYTGGLTKADAGTLTLSGTNTFTGGVSVNGGVLSFSSQANSGNGNLGSLASAKTITLGGGTLIYTGSTTISSNNLALNVTANSVLEVTDSAATLRSGGTLSGTGQLTINGPGVVALGQNAANATYGIGFTGDIVVSNGATLSLRNQNSMGSDSLGVATGTTTVQNGGTLLLDPFSQTSVSYNSETIAFQGSSTLTNRLNGQSSLSTAITGSVSTAGTLTVNTREDVLTSNAVSLEISGAITGNGGVNFGTTGGRAGTYIVSSNSNSYTGATNVNGGKLVLNGNISTSSLTTIASGATLAGSGTVGALSVLSGGTLAAGNSPGTLTVDGTLSLENLSILSFELNPGDTTVGGGINDLVTGVTNFTLDGLLNVTASTGSFTGVTSGIWRLFNYTGTLTNNGLSLNSMPALDSGYSWALDTATSNQVNLTIVPEPNVAGLLGGLGTLMLLRRRRK